MGRRTMTIDELVRVAPVIPVLVVEDPAQARSIAEAMVAGGLPVLEVTLRTPAALEVIHEMSRVDGAIVGGGTVLREHDLAACLDAGAQFTVSPGLVESLCSAAIDANVAVLPGVATAGDIMRGLSLGLDRFKFFPAVAAGGLPMLRALSAPFRQARFCPPVGLPGRLQPFGWKTL